MKKTLKQKQFLKLVKLWLSGNGNKQQRCIVEHYFDLFSEQDDILKNFSTLETRNLHDRMKSIIDEEISQDERQPFQLYLKYWSVAAVVLLVSAIALYSYWTNSKFNIENHKAIIAKSDIEPGSNKAILTLENGTQIQLTAIKKSKVATQSGLNLEQTNQGSLVYSKSKASAINLSYNTVSTPNGGQYMVILSDGTKVWLNAGSTLRYPVVFGSNIRKVELTGEAYFEVAKNVTKPFQVVSKFQSIEVLGTHFNVNDYDNDHLVSTILLEGSIEMKGVAGKISRIIKPGQQANLSKDYTNQFITVKQIDVEEAIAWKNGYFFFNDEPLESILRKISRWYDVEIVYSEDFNTKLTFSGTLSKYDKVSKVLRKLELSDAVHFTIEGRRIMIGP